MSDDELIARVEKSLRETHAACAAAGEFLPTPQLDGYFRLFHETFGPARLASLDGVVLLETLHAHGGAESLVRWLEFKDDQEFPTRQFGSIAGGSAHKLNLFRRKETGQWVTGSPQKERTLTEAEAVDLARHHRDQLLAGAAELEKVPPGNEDDEVCRALQGRMEEVAPDLHGRAWAHKYWSLLFPDRLDDYHNENLQRHHLLRLLQTPPEAPGIFASAGRFVRLARRFNWPMNHLTRTLNHRNGPLVAYYRVGTQQGVTWPAMRDGGFAAVGWDELGDLSTSAPSGPHLREFIRERLLGEPWETAPQVASRKAGEIVRFATGMEEGDVVLACNGQTVLGVGRARGPYVFDPAGRADTAHRRPVEWTSTDPWPLPEAEGNQTTCVRLNEVPNLLEAERRLLDPTPPLPAVPVRSAPATKPSLPPLDAVAARLAAILERKGQAILYGPPGTGKTFHARGAARELAARAEFGCPFEALDEEQRKVVEGSADAPGLVRFCTFHPAYGYEDFLEGYRPQASAAGQLVFSLRDGLFKRLCADAAAARERTFYLIVDEINRGDIPRIFGELLTLLELDKRGLAVDLPLSGESFSVPRNVRLIGTMNTADRSIALLDTALRRRFGFVELMPNASLLSGASAGGLPLGPWLASLNARIREHVGRDARNLQVGHAYLLEDKKPVTDFARFTRILAEDIVPLLEEYCYEDHAALARILGEALVDAERQRVREELFEPARREDLLEALLTEEIATSAAAARAAAATLEAQVPDEEPDLDGAAPGGDDSQPA